MGGLTTSTSTSKSTPTQTPQSNQTFSGATGAASTLAGLGNQYSQQQQQLYNSLFAKGTGAIPGFMSPSALNVTAPTGVYALQNTNANNAAASQYANNASAIKANAQQSGFGPNTPSGFTQQQLNQNAQALANTKGSNFSTATINQYQDALKNFWNAANLTQGAAQSSGQGALTGTSGAANTYANLYGRSLGSNSTGTQTASPMSVLSPLIGAGGQIGAAALGPGGAGTAAAACCAEGTLIRTGLKEFTPIEKLFEGARIFGLRENDDDPLVIWRPLAFAMKPCVRIKTNEGQELVCSTDHTLLLPGGGYVTAKESLSCSIRTRDGAVKVIAIEDAGERRVVRLHLDAPHVFESNELLSEE